MNRHMRYTLTAPANGFQRAYRRAFASAGAARLVATDLDLQDWEIEPPGCYGSNCTCHRAHNWYDDEPLMAETPANPRATNPTKGQGTRSDH